MCVYKYVHIHTYTHIYRYVVMNYSFYKYKNLCFTLLRLLFSPKVVLDYILTKLYIHEICFQKLINK